jgi:guanosine-3',5'-bis(diphosphate) 3'-pyrophosphohydrolase
MSNQLKAARDFALEKHGLQKDGDQSYIDHLDKVVKILEPYADETKVIAYLQGLIENTDTTLDEITAKFGSHIANCVVLLTDMTGKNKQETQLLTYKRMKAIDDQRIVALIVKAADRLANLQACLKLKKREKMQMYKEEHRLFKKSIFRGSLCDDIWIQIQNIIEQ